MEKDLNFLCAVIGTSTLHHWYQSIPVMQWISLLFEPMSICVNFYVFNLGSTIWLSSTELYSFLTRSKCSNVIFSCGNAILKLLFIQFQIYSSFSCTWVGSFASIRMSRQIMHIHTFHVINQWEINDNFMYIYRENIMRIQWSRTIRLCSSMLTFKSWNAPNCRIFYHVIKVNI